MQVTRVTGTLLNGVVFAIAAALGLWSAAAPDTYYAVVQEDGPVEWATFWAFMAAAGVAVRELAVSPGRQRWGLAAVAALCAFVAFEEISWGQRLLGYRPPVYFLEHNFQQELNVHNVASRSVRKLAVQALIAGYGVVLPLLCSIPLAARLAARVGIVAPSAALVPAFAATFVLYVWYPMRFAGEVVELMLGVCFLFSIVLRPPAGGVGRPLAAVCAVALLGVVSAALSQARAASPETLEVAGRELRALAGDLRRVAENEGGEGIGCGIHKRLYTYVEQYEVGSLRTGAFAGGAGDPASERHEFFLDPWNSPYWVRDKCADGGAQRSHFVYSFGPDRRRSSSAWELRPDDLGEYLVHR